MCPRAILLYRPEKSKTSSRFRGIKVRMRLSQKLQGGFSSEHQEYPQSSSCPQAAPFFRMEFRTFVASFVRIPCKIIRTGRKLVYRLLAWNAWQGVFFRLASHLCRPLRC